MKKFDSILVISVILVILTMSIWPSGLFAKETSLSIPEENFATPESAINYFLDSLKKNDLRKAFTACAIDEYSQGFDFEAHTNRMNAIMFYSSPAPSDYPFYVELTKCERMAHLSRQIKFFCFSLLATEKEYGITITNPTKERIAAFIESSNPAGLSGLEIISIDKPELVESERHKSNEIIRAKCFGAQDGTERVALIRFKGELDYFLIGFHLLKYKKSWKIDEMSSSLAGTSAFGTAEKIDISDYKQLIEPK